MNPLSARYGPRRNGLHPNTDHSRRYMWRSKDSIVIFPGNWDLEELRVLLNWIHSENLPYNKTRIIEFTAEQTTYFKLKWE